MSGLFVFIAVAIFILVNFVTALGRRPRQAPLPAPSGSGGRMPQTPRRPNLPPSPTQPTQETHMNPVSALIFIIFVGGAVLSFLARMPLPVPIALALAGVFLGYSIKMAQQWERAVI